MKDLSLDFQIDIQIDLQIDQSVTSPSGDTFIPLEV